MKMRGRVPLFTLLLPLSLHFGSTAAIASPEITREHCENLFRPEPFDPLARDLAFPPADSFLQAPRPIPKIHLGVIREDSDLLTRWMFLKNFRLENITASAGHQSVREPSAILKIAQSISENERVEGSKILLNLLTDARGKVLEVDIWDGHHRALGHLQAKTETLAELGRGSVEILVNGINSEGKAIPHLQPATGVDFTRSASWDGGYKIQESPGGIMDILVGGRVSNRALGSTYTLAQLLHSNLRDETGHIAIAFLPPGRIPRAADFRKITSLDRREVVFVPATTDRTSAKLREALEQKNAEKGVTRSNFYTASTSEYVGSFGLKSFLGRIQQTFASHSRIEFLHWTPDATSLSRYGKIDAETRNSFNRKFYEENLELSRTISTGASIKKFELPAAELKEIAKRNADRSYEKIYATARAEKLTETELLQFVEEIPLTFNDGITSVTTGEKGGQLGSGGYREFNYLPGDAGLSGVALQAQLKERTRSLVHEIAEALLDPKVDVISLAALAHDALAIEIKPFHDGTGRTSRALVDLILLRKGYPLPRYSGTERFGSNLLDRYFKAVKGKYFREFLEEALQTSFAETIP